MRIKTKDHPASHKWEKGFAWRIIPLVILSGLALFATPLPTGLVPEPGKTMEVQSVVTMSSEPTATPTGPANNGSMTETMAAPLLPGHTGDPRDMKVLVISPSSEQYFPNETPVYDTRYRLRAIKATLDQLGIPYDVYIANQGAAHTRLTEKMLWDGVNHGYYQGIILETGNQYIYAGNKTYIPFLSTQEWTTLWNYEAVFGVRELVMFVSPNRFNAETFGLTYAGEQFLAGAGMLTTLTGAGKNVYSYLNAANPLQFTSTYYISVTLEVGDPHPAVPLVIDPSGSPVVSTHVGANGHETLAITADYSPNLVSSLALSYGSLNWLMKGVFLGERHTYLAPQVDDLLIADFVWDPATLSDKNQTYRINDRDLEAVKAWQLSTFPPLVDTCVTLEPTNAADGSYPDEQSLIRFDLSGIPVDAAVNSAVFDISLDQSSGSQTDTVEIHRITRSWTAPGGDYDAALEGTLKIGTAGLQQVDIPHLVQRWVSAPDSNFGMILLLHPSNNASNNLKEYASSSGKSSSQPKLTVCYTVPTFRFEFAFVGKGATGMYKPDLLTPQVIKDQAYFRWVTHTYSHKDLDVISAADVSNELSQNDNAAVNLLGFTFYSRETLIQPNISGMTNRDFLSSAYAFGTRSMIANTSLPEWNNPSPNTGFYSTVQPGILIIPRHPTNLYYNVITPEQWVSEYNCYFGPNATCGDGKGKIWDHDLTFEEILDKESTVMLQYLLKWDIDPLMFHQANLAAYDGKNSLLTRLIDATLAKYRMLITLPIRNLSQNQIAEKMAERMAYNASGVKGTLLPCKAITLTAERAAKIPLTGISYGDAQESYGGQDLSYVSIGAGETLDLPVACR